MDEIRTPLGTGISEMVETDDANDLEAQIQPLYIRTTENTNATMATAILSTSFCFSGMNWTNISTEI